MYPRPCERNASRITLSVSSMPRTKVTLCLEALGQQLLDNIWPLHTCVSEYCFSLEMTDIKGGSEMLPNSRDGIEQTRKDVLGIS